MKQVHVTTMEVVGLSHILKTAEKPPQGNARYKEDDSGKVVPFKHVI